MGGAGLMVSMPLIIALRSAQAEPRSESGAKPTADKSCRKPQPSVQARGRNTAKIGPDIATIGNSGTVAKK